MWGLAALEPFFNIINPKIKEILHTVFGKLLNQYGFIWGAAISAEWRAASCIVTQLKHLLQQPGCPLGDAHGQKISLVMHKVTNMLTFQEDKYITYKLFLPAVFVLNLSCCLVYKRDTLPYTQLKAVGSVANFCMSVMKARVSVWVPNSISSITHGLEA